MLISPLVAPPFASDRNFGRIVKPQISVTESATGAPNARFCPGRFFVRERTRFTKGEQAIIHGILRNRLGVSGVTGANGDGGVEFNMAPEGEPDWDEGDGGGGGRRRSHAGLISLSQRLSFRILSEIISSLYY